MSDHFKIVAVLKKRGASTIVDYSYVPHKWENNGVLYWPKTNLNSLREDSGSEPQQDWSIFKCKVKKNHIIGHEEAELWEEQFVNATGTDAEDSLCIKKSTNVVKSHCQLGGKPKSVYDKQFEEIASPSPLSVVTDDHSTIYSVSVGDAIELNGSQSEILHRCGCNEAKIVEVHEETKTILERQNRMYERFSAEFLQLKLTSDSMYKILKDIQARLGLTDNKGDQERAYEETENFSQRFVFPLNNCTDVLNFNNEIVNNSEYKTYLIKKYTSIGGSDGSEDGKVVSKKLLAVLFSKYVLTLFSWTGISRTKGLEKKECFQSCQGILSLFHDVVAKADSRWNESKNEKFFKLHILKHAKQSNEAYEKKIKKSDNTNDVEETTQVEIEEHELFPEIEHTQQDFELLYNEQHK